MKDAPDILWLEEIRRMISFQWEAKEPRLVRWPPSVFRYLRHLLLPRRHSGISLLKQGLKIRSIQFSKALMSMKIMLLNLQPERQKISYSPFRCQAIWLKRSVQLMRAWDLMRLLQSGRAPQPKISLMRALQASRKHS